MSAAATPPPVLPEQTPSPEKTLRELFLTLFLRGRSLRNLGKRGVQGAPKSVWQKLGLVLISYCLFGCMALFFLRQPVFALAVYLHAMTFVFLGMFVASSAGEVLFNKEEADILMHRPISPKTMLWAKIRVLVEVSLWLAGAFNLAGLFVGFGSAGNWLFPIAHLISTTLEALFCTGSVVLVYQLCLRWFGRERLEGLMTIAQVTVSLAAVLAGQILPQLLIRFDRVLDVSQMAWWINFFPPAWFAGFDDALSGTRMPGAWLLTVLAVGATALVLWLAFGKLARDYETGLQALNETVSSRAKKQGHRRWLDRLMTIPPLSWWLRDPVERASFLLVAAYLVRDRDVKLRVYPGIAPVLIVPFIFVFRNAHGHSGDPGFGVPLSGVYMGLVPLLGLQMLQYSQQWQASDVFRAAPIPGPGPLCHGARRAVLCLLTLPLMILVGLIVWLTHRDLSQLALLLPGLIALPVFALVPNLGGRGVPLSLPTDEAKAAGRSLNMILVMIISFALAGAASLAWAQGWFWWLMLAECITAGSLYFLLRLKLNNAPWPSMEG